MARLNIDCLAAGTLIRTARGDVAVEMLAISDLVVTASGSLRPIRCLGHRDVDCRAHPAPRKVWPIRVAADAFGRNRPACDLYVSPEHLLCVDVVEEVLIPAEKLVNGSTVSQVERDSVTYWHVELDGGHNILWAAGMPVESFLERGANRALLGLPSENVSVNVFARTHADLCRPFHETGPIVTAVRAQLDSRAERLGWAPERDPRLVAVADGKPLHPRVVGGEAFVEVPNGISELRLRSAVRVPAAFGEADTRRLGLAVYALTLTDCEGVTNALDLDDPLLRGFFHEGERMEGRHYRWTHGELVIPSIMMARLTGPLMLRLTFEPSTVRGWTARELEPVRGTPDLHLIFDARPRSNSTPSQRSLARSVFESVAGAS